MLLSSAEIRGRLQFKLVNWVNTIHQICELTMAVSYIDVRMVHGRGDWSVMTLRNQISQGLCKVQ